MNWTINEQITTIAGKISVDLADANPNQYPGDLINTNLWKNFTLSRNFPPELVVCSPANIIKCFQDDLFLEGLILTINWGKMNKTVEKIFNKDIRTIDECLTKCKKDIAANMSINNSWAWLIDELGWTNVMASKVLHFLCRSFDYTNVPAPIDRAQIIKKFIPRLGAFLQEKRTLLGIEEHQINELLDWSGYSLTSFLKYMNFILTWSPNGNTTAFEVRLFNLLKSGELPTLRLVRQ
ncbi:MAG: hypothetical protein IT279_06285 [Ignavibacteriaceae bacterium]|nr:hypothetical protein [Ignavibacteriaceae bacterium]